MAEQGAGGGPIVTQNAPAGYHTYDKAGEEKKSGFCTKTKLAVAIIAILLLALIAGLIAGSTTGAFGDGDSDSKDDNNNGPSPSPCPKLENFDEDVLFVVDQSSGTSGGFSNVFAGDIAAWKSTVDQIANFVDRFNFTNTRFGLLPFSTHFEGGAAGNAGVLLHNNKRVPFQSSEQLWAQKLEDNVRDSITYFWKGGRTDVASTLDFIRTSADDFKPRAGKVFNVIYLAGNLVNQPFCVNASISLLNDGATDEADVNSTLLAECFSNGGKLSTGIESNGPCLLSENGYDYTGRVCTDPYFAADGSLTFQTPEKKGNDAFEALRAEYPSLKVHYVVPDTNNAVNTRHLFDPNNGIPTGVVNLPPVSGGVTNLTWALDQIYDSFDLECN